MSDKMNFTGLKVQINLFYKSIAVILNFFGVCIKLMSYWRQHLMFHYFLKI